MDHLSEIGLRDKYKDSQVDLDQIEPVDFVWWGQPFSELVGKYRSYDWIIASHLIEHTPDLIGFLNNCSDILSDSGVLSLAIPDKRYCFDHFRPLSGLGQVIDKHSQRSNTHSRGTVAEHLMYAVSRSGQLGWNSCTSGKFQFSHTLPDIKQFILDSDFQTEYIDVHAWCFVPHSFRLLIHDLHALGLIDFQELSFHNTVDHEFFITLNRNGSCEKTPRTELLRNMQREVSGSNSPPVTIKGRLKNMFWRLQTLVTKM
jgi:hypothetical protein